MWFVDVCSDVIGFYDGIDKAAAADSIVRPCYHTHFRSLWYVACDLLLFLFVAMHIFMDIYPDQHQITSFHVYTVFWWQKLWCVCVEHNTIVLVMGH